MLGRAKPPIGWDIDRSHPLGRCLEFCPLFNERNSGQVWDYGTRQLLTRVTSGSPYSGPSTLIPPTWKQAASTPGRIAYPGMAGDPTIQFNGTADNPWYARVDGRPFWTNPPVGGYTFASIFRPLNTTSGLTRIMDSDVGGAFCIYINHTVGTCLLSVKNYTGGVVQVTIPFVVGDWMSILCSIAPNRLNVYNAGQLVGTAAGVSPVAAWAGAMGQQAVNYTQAVGDTTFTLPIQVESAYPGMIWSEPLGSAQAALWYSAPGCMFAPPGGW